KTFFFGGFQGITQRQATTTTSSTPVAAWRTGDFSNVPGLNVFDPATGNPDGSGRQLFPNNTIPAGRISEVSRKLSALLPSPNQAGFANNLIVNVPFRQNSFNYDGRADHNFSEKTRLFVKFNYSDYAVRQGAPLGDVVGEATRANDYTTTST